MNKKINDLNYLSNIFFSLTNQTIRVFDNAILVNFKSSFKITNDPLSLIDYQQYINDNIGYFQDKYFYYYAYLNIDSYILIVGPFTTYNHNDNIIRKIALDLAINNENDIKSFISSIKESKPIQLKEILQYFIMLNYVLTKERIDIDQLIEKEENSIDLKNDILRNILNNSYESSKEYDENKLLDIVENGKIDDLNIMLGNSFKNVLLKNAENSLRSVKNNFIVISTLASRASIKACLEKSEALGLFDLYIQKMELLTNNLEILSLQDEMLRDFTKRVAKIKGTNVSSTFIIKLNKYIIEHISDAIKIEDVCNSFSISKTTLLQKIKDETNMTFSDYVLKLKINESKELLKSNSRSLSSISIYLGFSSQSHFNHTFKKYTGTTPSEYKSIYLK